MLVRPRWLSCLTTAVLLSGLGTAQAQSVLPPPQKPRPVSEKPQGQDERLRRAQELFTRGLQLQKKRDLVGARKCYEEALAIRRKALPKDHRGLAISLIHLGNVLG